MDHEVSSPMSNQRMRCVSTSTAANGAAFITSATRFPAIHCCLTSRCELATHGGGDGQRVPQKVEHRFGRPRGGGGGGGGGGESGIRLGSSFSVAKKPRDAKAAMSDVR